MRDAIQQERKRRSSTQVYNQLKAALARASGKGKDELKILRGAVSAAENLADAAHLRSALAVALRSAHTLLQQLVKQGPQSRVCARPKARVRTASKAAGRRGPVPDSTRAETVIQSSSQGGVATERQHTKKERRQRAQQERAERKEQRIMAMYPRHWLDQMRSGSQTQGPASVSLDGPSFVSAPARMTTRLCLVPDCAVLLHGGMLSRVMDLREGMAVEGAALNPEGRILSVCSTVRRVRHLPRVERDLTMVVFGEGHVVLTAHHPVLGQRQTAPWSMFEAAELRRVGHMVYARTVGRGEQAAAATLKMPVRTWSAPEQVCEVELENVDHAIFVGMSTCNATIAVFGTLPEEPVFGSPLTRRTFIEVPPPVPTVERRLSRSASSPAALRAPPTCTAHAAAWSGRVVNILTGGENGGGGENGDSGRSTSARGSNTIIFVGESMGWRSIGSAKHSDGTCQPCRWERRRFGACVRGAQCLFCHERHRRRGRSR